jgi:hypothetical protein
MNVRSWALAAAVCVLAAPGALAQRAAPTDSKPAAGPTQPSAGARDRSWPRLAPANVPAEAKPPALIQWSALEIELAQARCTALLKGLDVVVVPETPIREGVECGTAAPMKLLSLGRGPQVALSPPPTITCDMIVALYRWMERDVQPLARKHMGSPVIRIEAMSSYSCRNAYGRADSRLSEHGKANALDIGAFVTARGQTAMVVADWGPTAREIAEQAAAQAEAEKARADAPPMPAGPQQNGAGPGQSAAQPVTAATPGAAAGATISIPGLSINIPGLPSARPPELGLTQPNRLGGPKPASPAPVAPAPAATRGRTEFLRAAHSTACKVFGTVLGPEANRAHKNHFHVDMAERKTSAICE